MAALHGHAGVVKELCAARAKLDARMRVRASTLKLIERLFFLMSFRQFAQATMGSAASATSEELQAAAASLTEEQRSKWLERSKTC